MESICIWMLIATTLLTPASAQVSDQNRQRPVVYDEGAWPPGMTFDFGQTVLKPYTISVLNEAAEILKKYPELKAEIAGHTDAVGPASFNQKLSLRRANAAYEYLVRLGIDPSRLKPVGYGESRPIWPNTEENGSDNPEGREKNRRIELNVDGCSSARPNTCLHY